MPKVIKLDEHVDPTARLLGERVKALRRSAKLTQADVATKVRSTTAYICQIERGKANPTLDVMVRLSRLFAVEVAELIRPEIGTKVEGDQTGMD